jgi:hypothetical protein
MGGSGGSDLIHYMLESFMDPQSKNDPTTNQQTRKGKRLYPTSENRERIAEKVKLTATIICMFRTLQQQH